jgi:hypothetical protein
MIGEVIERHWPAEIANSDIRNAELIGEVEQARIDLLRALDLCELA